MTVLTKQELELEISTLSNNILTLKMLGGDITEHIKRLDAYRSQLLELILANSNTNQIGGVTKDCANSKRTTHY